MKEMMILLFILIQIQVTFEVVLENELIGIWKIEKIQVIPPGVCIENDFHQNIGTTFKFTKDHLLFITSNKDWFPLDNGDQLFWYLEDQHLNIKSKNHQEDYRSKIIFKKKVMTINLSNFLVIRLIKK